MIIRDINPVKNIQNVIIYMPSSMKHSGIKIYKFYQKKKQLIILQLKDLEHQTIELKGYVRLI